MHVSTMPNTHISLVAALPQWIVVVRVNVCCNIFCYACTTLGLCWRRDSSISTTAPGPQEQQAPLWSALWSILHGATGRHQLQFSAAPWLPLLHHSQGYSLAQKYIRSNNLWSVNLDLAKKLLSCIDFLILHLGQHQLTPSDTSLLNSLSIIGTAHLTIMHSPCPSCLHAKLLIL